MYEDQTYSAILARMQGRVSDTNSKLDTREGSMTWLGNAPAAVELQNLYIALDNILKESFADTASRQYLILRAAERGLTPYAASAAVLELTITPATLNLDMGERFSIGELNYYVSEKVSAGVYEIICETAGEAGNDYGDTVIPIEYIDGLETCTVTALLIPGEDEEDTEVFRQRYFDSLNAQAFGGNQADYIEKVNAISGVGGVKVYRAWNSDLVPSDMIPSEAVQEWYESIVDTLDEEPAAWLEAVYTNAKNSKLTVGGTVKVVIIDSAFSAPSNTLIDTVQTALDPTQNAGEGLGIAPIGHVVKVVGVGEETVNVSFTLYYQDGWTWDDVSAYVTEAIQDYFKELAETWADTDGSIVVRISQIESRLLTLSGILDIADTMINGVPSNSSLAVDYIPVLGTLTATTGEST